MPYTGPALVCRRCGQSFTRPGSLRRHRAERRCPGQTRLAIVPAKRARPARLDAPRAIQGEIVDVAPIGREIVPRTRESAPPSPVLARSGDEPEWFAREFPEDARRTPWRKLEQSQRQYYESRHAAMRGFAASLSRPDGVDSVALWEQFYFLKALAARLDARRGTERDRSMFEAGLREYNANYDRIAQRKALPG